LDYFAGVRYALLLLLCGSVGAKQNGEVIADILPAIKERPA